MYTHTCTYAHKQRARMHMVTYMHTYPNMSSCTNGHSHKCAHARTYPTYVNKEHIRVDTSTHKLTCAHRPRQGPSTGGKTQKPQESQVFIGPGCVMGAVGDRTGGWHSSAGPGGRRTLSDPVRTHLPSSRTHGGQTYLIPHDLSRPDPVKQHDQGNSVLEMRPRDPERLRKFSRSHSGERWAQPQCASRVGAHSERARGKKASRRKQGSGLSRKRGRGGNFPPSPPLPSPWFSESFPRWGEMVNDQQGRLPVPLPLR